MSFIDCNTHNHQFTLIPTTLFKSVDSITTNLSDISDPSELNWVGLYPPPDSHHHNFIGYFFLSDTLRWKSGYGSFPLINLRHLCPFRIFRWTKSEVDPPKINHDQNPLPQTKHLIVQSREVSFELPNEPEQVHLAFIEKEDEMSVVFVAVDGEKRFVKYDERERE